MWFTDRHAGAAIAFTDATEGNVAAHTGEDPAQVAAHRAALEDTLELSAGSLRFMRQVHGTPWCPSPLNPRVTRTIIRYPRSPKRPRPMPRSAKTARPWPS
ncbi:laccase domain-containing protein [Kocuria atrinae]|uniref:laccase domain-containing protein n=1 Tax=Kocuria atrinae TaxID=592377 RepID=UPI00294235ED|nr:laccase domain-containing protein [Kocuria atrinae]